MGVRERFGDRTSVRNSSLSPNHSTEELRSYRTAVRYQAILGIYKRPAHLFTRQTLGLISPLGSSQSDLKGGVRVRSTYQHGHRLFASTKPVIVMPLITTTVDRDRNANAIREERRIDSNTCEQPIWSDTKVSRGWRKSRRGRRQQMVY